jgi:hypothetical protein
MGAGSLRLFRLNPASRLPSVAAAGRGGKQGLT